MNTADWAIVISLCALAISASSFIWNVWSTFIHPKPKSKVTWWKVHPDIPSGNDELIVLECVNLGPTDLILQGPVLPTLKPNLFKRTIHFWRLWGDASGVPNGGSATTEKLDWPRKLSAGEAITVSIEISAVVAAIKKDKPTGIGFLDTFDRFHILPEKGFAKILDVIGKEQ